MSSASQCEKLRKHFGAFNVRVSSTPEGQIVMEFMDGTDPVPFMRGEMTLTAALEVAHLLFDRVQHVAAEDDEKIRKLAAGPSRKAMHQKASVQGDLPPAA